MSVVSDLWKLQEIDSALDTRRASLEDAEARIGESEELVAARERSATLQSALRDAQSAQKDVELEADDLKAKIGPVETKLYGGSIRNPKELKDLQADIDQLKRHLSEVEDRGLEALAAVETAENEYRTASSELEAIEAAWRDEQKELSDRVQRLRAEIAVYDEQREEQAAYVDATSLATYKHLRLARNGRPLAKLDRNLCTGCRISLPTNTVNKARAGSALVHCPNCERILVA